MEERDFIPDIVGFLNKRHRAAVALIGSRAEGFSHPVSYDFLCLHEKEAQLGPSLPGDMEAIWDRPPSLRPDAPNIESFTSRGRSVLVVHRTLGDISEETDALLEGDLSWAGDELYPATAVLRSLQKMHPLADPEGALRALKARVQDYSGPLRRALLSWSLETLAALPGVLEGRRECGDSPFLSVLIRRASLALVKGLFALNREYYPGPRRMLRLVEKFELAPPRAVTDLHALFSGGDRGAELKDKLPLLERQAEVFVRLAEEEIAGIHELGEEQQQGGDDVIA